MSEEEYNERERMVEKVAMIISICCKLSTLKEGSSSQMWGELYPGQKVWKWQVLNYGRALLSWFPEGNDKLFEIVGAQNNWAEIFFP